MDEERDLGERTDLAARPPGAPPAASVGRPAEVVRVAMATREVLVELRSHELSDDARRRATALYDRSVERLGELLSDDLRRELSDLAPARAADAVPSTDELRVADAQLSGWLDGLLQNLQAAAVVQAQQAEADRAQAAARAEAADEAERRRRDTSYL